MSKALLKALLIPKNTLWGYAGLTPADVSEADIAE
jgi:hypothetical protein